MTPWTLMLAVAGSALPVFGASFAVFKYLNKRGQPKIKVVRKALLLTSVLLPLVYVAGLLMLPPQSGELTALAQNKVYQHDETSLLFAPASQAEDEICELDGIAPTAGRQCALHDFGTTARASVGVLRCFVQFATAPVVGQAVEIYWKSSDGTHPDNDDGTGDAGISSIDKLKNLKLVGLIIVDEAVQDIEMVFSGLLRIPARYGAPVIWNATADAFTTDEAENGCTWTPVP